MIVDAACMHPSTAITRLNARQSDSRERLDELLDSTVLATVAFIRDGHPVALPTAAARLGDEVVIHGSSGSPWLTELAGGVPVSVSVSASVFVSVFVNVFVNVSVIVTVIVTVSVSVTLSWSLESEQLPRNNFAGRYFPHV